MNVKTRSFAIATVAVAGVTLGTAGWRSRAYASSPELISSGVTTPTGDRTGRDDDDDDDRGRRYNAAVLPTGQYITPTAISGALQQFLNPGLLGYPNFVAGEAVRSQLSPDGTTLAVITAGQNSLYKPDGAVDVANSTQFVFLYNVEGANKARPALAQVIQQTNAHVGLVFSPDGETLYAAGGNDDAVYVYTRSGSTFMAAMPIALGHFAPGATGGARNKGVGVSVQPNASGLGISADGQTLVVANNYNDSISVIDTATRSVRYEHDLRPYFANNEGRDGGAGGTFPFAVVVKGNDTAYVSSDRDREVVVVSLSSTTAPGRLITRIKLDGNALGMTLDASQSTLFVAQDNADQVAVIDTSTNRVSHNHWGRSLTRSVCPDASAGVRTRLLRAVDRVMADVARFDDEDDVFGDVGGVIANALEVPRNQDEIDRRLDGVRVAEDIGQQLSEDLILERIELVVLDEDSAGTGDVAGDERVERLAEHTLRQIAHSRQIDQRLDGRVRDVPLGGFADIDCEVGDAFEIAVDLHGGDDGPEIDRHRLVQRQQLEATVVDFDMHLVDRLVAGDDVGDRLTIPVDEPVHGQTDALLGHAAHQQQPLFELRELFREVSWILRHWSLHSQPNRPVT